MRAVDTNVLVRLVVRDTLHQVDAADAFVANGAWVSHLVLAELSWVLASVYRRSAKQIAQAIELLLEHRELTLQDEEVVAAALVQFRRRPRLGFSDCLMLEVARRAGHLPLGTFDRGLSQLDGAVRLG
ncbi:MAG: type II toxin-antitoxin system VapC family toxin [Deltaproteobacteria bacterium]|nr:type II toxin-antitoxin system VapC family toxin [Deltaproteobacteria bacterium]